MSGNLQDKDATFDPDVNAIYVYLSDGPWEQGRTEQVSATVNVDRDTDGRICGVEVLLPDP